MRISYNICLRTNTFQNYFISHNSTIRYFDNVVFRYFYISILQYFDNSTFREFDRLMRRALPTFRSARASSNHEANISTPLSACLRTPSAQISQAQISYASISVNADKPLERVPRRDIAGSKWGQDYVIKLTHCSVLLPRQPARRCAEENEGLGESGRG